MTASAAGAPPGGRRRTGADDPAELVLDLRLDAQPSPDDGRLTLAELAALVRRPRELRAALRGRRYGAVVVERDPVPLSGVQAGALVLAAAARARRFDEGGGPRRRAPFLARAVAATARALPLEVARSVGLYRRAARAAAHDPALPLRTSVPPRSVLYLRTDPALRWRGHMVGGAATHTSGVINGFAAKELDVEVVAAERPEGIDAVRVTAVPLARAYHLVPWLTLAGHGEAIARAAAGRRPDFVYQRYSVGAWAGLEVAERLGVPLVLEYNGSELWIQRHWGGESESRFTEVLTALEERNVRAASLVVVVSAVLKEQLVEAGVDPARVLVNPNGVDVERLAPYRERPAEAWRAELGLADAPTVGFVGSFGHWHGVTVLPEMIERVPQARWVLIGDGQLHQQVREEIAARGLSDRVALPGIVAHDRALAMLAACDVCVSPHVPNPDGTRFFGSPTKLFEYMGLGKAIVASDLEQLGEVLDDGETGLLCPPADAAAAADAVTRALGDPALRERLGAAALAKAASEYSWAAHTRRILDALA